MGDESLGVMPLSQVSPHSYDLEQGPNGGGELFDLSTPRILNRGGRKAKALKSEFGGAEAAYGDNELSFAHLTSTPMPSTSASAAQQQHSASNSSGSYPTAQSTPVGPSHGRRNASLSSTMLTTPNNTGLEDTPKNGGEGNGAAGSSPSARGSASKLLSEAPRTPTPFKRALAHVYAREDPLSRTVSKSLASWHARKFSRKKLEHMTMNDRLT